MQQGGLNIDVLKTSILKVLKNDPKTMPLRVLMHKVFQDIKLNLKDKSLYEYISQEQFMQALNELMQVYLVGKNKFDKYFIDYLDYEEGEVEGEGYLEIDATTGNGFITSKTHPKEYKKSAYFVHKKNLSNAQTGNYVRFVELKISDKKHLNKFPLKDVRVKEVLPDPFPKS